jgi:sugar phosphate isomerase/epimerase
MLKFATKLPPNAAKIEAAWTAGFRSAEVYLNADMVKDWKNSVQALKTRPLQYVLHFPNKGPLGPGKLKKAAKLYRALDGHTMVIHPGMKTEYGDRLLNRHPGICLAVENGKLRYDQFHEWADEYDDLTLDVEHLWKYSLEDAPLEDLCGELRAFLWRFGSKLRHVHLPGYRPGSSEHRPTYRSPAMARSILDILVTAGFTGMVVSEARESLRSPDQLAADFKFYRQWAGKSSPKRVVAQKLGPATALPPL